MVTLSTRVANAPAPCDRFPNILVSTHMTCHLCLSLFDIFMMYRHAVRGARCAICKGQFAASVRTRLVDRGLTDASPGLGFGLYAFSGLGITFSLHTFAFSGLGITLCIVMAARTDDTSYMYVLFWGSWVTPPLDMTCMSH